MDKKFSIVINHNQNDSYSLVICSFDLDEDGNRINVEPTTKILSSLEECINEVLNIVNNGK